MNSSKCKLTWWSAIKSFKSLHFVWYCDRRAYIRWIIAVTLPNTTACIKAVKKKNNTNRKNWRWKMLKISITFFLKDVRLRNLGMLYFCFFGEERRKREGWNQISLNKYKMEISCSRENKRKKFVMKHMTWPILGAIMSLGISLKLLLWFRFKHVNAFQIFFFENYDFKKITSHDGDDSGINVKLLIPKISIKYLPPINIMMTQKIFS